MDDVITINGVEYVRRNPENRPPPTAGSVWRNKDNGLRFLVVNISDDSYRDEICVVSIDGILSGRLHRAVIWLSFYREHEMIGTITSLRLE